MVKNVRLILKKLSVRYPNGDTDTLGDYLKRMPVDEIKSDLHKILNTMITRVDATDDRRVLTDFYAIFLSLNVEKNAVIPVDKNNTDGDTND